MHSFAPNPNLLERCVSFISFSRLCISVVTPSIGGAMLARRDARVMAKRVGNNSVSESSQLSPRSACASIFPRARRMTKGCFAICFTWSIPSADSMMGMMPDKFAK